METQPQASETPPENGAFEFDPRPLLALHPRDADRLFASPAVHGKFLNPDFRENLRPLAQIYQGLQRFLQGLAANRKADSYYPTVTELYRDVQEYRRTINDKAVMPDQQQFERYCLMLAACNPPFVHVLRELKWGEQGFEFASLMAAPTEKHEDKVVVAYQGTLTTSTKLLRDVVRSEGFGFNYGSLFEGAPDATQVPVHRGRVDHVLKRCYFNEKDYKAISQSDINNLRRVNQELFRRIYRPLLLQGIKESLFVSFSCNDFRKAGFPGSDQVYDVVLFRSMEEIKNRYAALTHFLRPDMMAGLLSSDTVEQIERRFKAGELDEAQMPIEKAKEAYQMAIRQDPVPIPAVLLCAEIMLVGQWLRTETKVEAKAREEDELKQILKRLRAGGLHRVRSNRDFVIPEKYLRPMLQGRLPAVLAVTDPYDAPSNINASSNLDLYENIFVLYRGRENSAKAIDTAIELYENNSDTVLLHVVEELLGLGRTPEAKLKEFVPPIHLDRLRQALRSSYATRLPVWRRFLLWITSSQPGEQTIIRLRRQRRKERGRSVDRAQEKSEKRERKQARTKVKRLARSRVEAGEAGDSSDNLGEDEARALKRVEQYLDTQWLRGSYPSRSDIESSIGNETHLAHALDLIDLAAVSARSVVRVPVGADAIYATRSFLEENREALLEQMDSRLEQDQAFIQGDRELRLRGSESKKELYRAVRDFLRRLG